jgi:beta-lactam-binding protein with PASTA domain
VQTSGPQLPTRLFVAVLAVGLAAGCGTASSSTSSVSVSPGTPTSQPSSAAPTGDVTVPPLIGTSEGLAFRQLAYDGLKAKQATAANLYFGSDVVLATSPSGDDPASRGVTVIVYVSLGPELALPTCTGECFSMRYDRDMPDVCGLTFQEAATKLVPMDITLEPPHGNPNPPGRITGSSPAAGQHFTAYGSTAARPVTVTLSTAPSGAVSAGTSC